MSFGWLLATYLQLDTVLNISDKTTIADVGIRFFYDQFRKVEHCLVGNSVASRDYYPTILTCDLSV